MKALSLFLLATFLQITARAAQTVYLAPDDHTDFIWSATEAEYYGYFKNMLDYYLDQANNTVGEQPKFQSKFTLDGSLWLKSYRDGSAAISTSISPATPPSTRFNELIMRIKDGHITPVMTPLVVNWGAVPAEAVLRSMYFPGKLERQYGFRFTLAQEMENQTLPFGLGALWAGSGVKYSWKGVCDCASVIPNATRAHEIYRWHGLDGSDVLMKWFSAVSGAGINDNEFVGGYAEARHPAEVTNFVTTDASFATRYAYNLIGLFGQGWDDRETENLNLQQFAKNDNMAGRSVVVSNTVDFFQDFEAQSGASLVNFNASFGNEWDLAPTSLAEVSATVKRSIEKLRAAEGMATLVSAKSATFSLDPTGTREVAQLDMGLYFEHDFGDGGPGASATERRAWQRRLAGEIKTYVDSLHANAANSLGGMIAKTGTNLRFFVFNPLSWTRTDAADCPYSGPTPLHVIDVGTSSERPSQVITVSGQTFLRIQALNVPPLGYKVFEIVPGAGVNFQDAQAPAAATTGTAQNSFYALFAGKRGAITSLKDKTRSNKEFASSTSGKYLNDLGGSDTGTRTVENAGPVSATLVCTSASVLNHTTRITLFRESPRIEIKNDITQNFGNTATTYNFTYNLTSPNIWHEEVGAVLNAKLTMNGGHYSPQNARYDFLTLNHFADVSGLQSTTPLGVTLSNADCYFMKTGASTTSFLDTTRAQIAPLAGGQVTGLGCANQDGDTLFTQHFALTTHDAYDPVASMKFALEHQNPLVTGTVSGGSVYPATTYSFVTISDPSVLLWALKPSEEGIGNGIIVRVWNCADTAKTFTLSLPQPILRARQVSHIESDIGWADLGGGGTLSATIPAHKILSFRLFTSATDAWRFANFTEPETVNPAISGDYADPDGDGIPNLLECGLHLAPKVADNAGLPFPDKVLIGAKHYLTLTYTQALSAGLKYQPEVSGNFGAWNFGIGFVVPVNASPNPDGTQTITVRDAAAIEDNPTRFMRLRLLK